MEENRGSQDGPERLASGGSLTPPDATPAAVLASPNDEHRSPFLTTCPFFRRIDARDQLAVPVEAPDPANRCAAFGDPKAQSARQQELVCLTRTHADCPRYLRGVVLLEDGGTEPPPAPPRRASRHVSGPIFAALVLLALSAGASFAFIVVRGGLGLPLGPDATQVAAAITASPRPAATPTLTPIETAAPSPTPSATPRPTPTPSPSPTPAPTPSPTAAPTPTPAVTPRPTPTPRPTSDRYALLTPCADQPRCYVYTVRSGDNLYSIANYFGHSLETVYRLNPWARSTPLRAGQQLILPPPTR